MQGYLYSQALGLRVMVCSVTAQEFVAQTAAVINHDDRWYYCHQTKKPEVQVRTARGVTKRRDPNGASGVEEKWNRFRCYGADVSSWLQNWLPCTTVPKAAA